MVSPGISSSSNSNSGGSCMIDVKPRPTPTEARAKAEKNASAEEEANATAKTSAKEEWQRQRQEAMAKAEAKTSAKDERQRQKAVVTMADDTLTYALMMMAATVKAKAKITSLQKSWWTKAKTREGQKQVVGAPAAKWVEKGSDEAKLTPVGVVAKQMGVLCKKFPLLS